MKITGLEEIQKSISELEKALGELDGNIASLQFDPHDPQSIEQAIQTAHQAIDERIARFANNEIVAGMVADLKENIRAEVLERAAAARLSEEGKE